MENKKKFIIDVIYYGVILALVYLFINYLLPMVLPFLLAWLIAYFSIIIIKNLIKKDNRVIRIVVTTLLFCLIFFLISLIAVISVNKTIGIVETIPNIYSNYIVPGLDSLEKELIHLNNRFSLNMKTNTDSIISYLTNGLKDAIGNISTSLVSFGTSLISNTTSVILNVIIIIVCAYFFVLDYEMIMKYLDSLIPKKNKKTYLEIKNFIFNNVFKVIRTYIVIMFITFIELLIGFIILDIDNRVILALLISVLDILPVLGVGTVLIPWGIIDLIINKYVMGIGILLLYLVITIIRNIIEPKLVGTNLGLHPLATLAAMMIGLETFGVFGMFGFPLTMSFFIKRKDLKIDDLD